MKKRFLTLALAIALLFGFSVQPSALAETSSDGEAGGEPIPIMVYSEEEAKAYWYGTEACLTPEDVVKSERYKELFEEDPVVLVTDWYVETESGRCILPHGDPQDALILPATEIYDLFPHEKYADLVSEETAELMNLLYNNAGILCELAIQHAMYSGEFNPSLKDVGWDCCEVLRRLSKRDDVGVALMLGYLDAEPIVYGSYDFSPPKAGEKYVLGRYSERLIKDENGEAYPDPVTMALELLLCHEEFWNKLSAEQQALVTEERAEKDAERLRACERYSAIMRYFVQGLLENSPFPPVSGQASALAEAPSDGAASGEPIMVYSEEEAKAYWYGTEACLTPEDVVKSERYKELFEKDPVVLVTEEHVETQSGRCFLPSGDPQDFPIVPATEIYDLFPHEKYADLVSEETAELMNLLYNNAGILCEDVITLGLFSNLLAPSFKNLNDGYSLYVDVIRRLKQRDDAGVALMLGYLDAEPIVYGSYRSTEAGEEHVYGQYPERLIKDENGEAYPDPVTTALEMLLCDEEFWCKLSAEQQTLLAEERAVRNVERLRVYKNDNLFMYAYCKVAFNSPFPPVSGQTNTAV